MRRVVGQQARRHGLAVQPLLQVVERRDLARRAGPAARRRAPRRSTACSRTSGNARADVVAVARIEPRLAAVRRRAARGCRPISIRRGSRPDRSGSISACVHRIGQHRRAEGQALIDRGRPGAALEPGEEGLGRAAPARTRSPRSAPPACRRPPASAALARRADTPTRIPPISSLSSAKRPGRIQRVEPAGEQPRHLGSARGAQPVDDPRPGMAAGPSTGRLRPDQRHRLRQVADVVVGQPEQHRIDPLLDELAHQRRLDVTLRQPAGHRGERPAAVRVGRGRQIIRRAAGACRCATGV